MFFFIYCITLTGKKKEKKTKKVLGAHNRCTFGMEKGEINKEREGEGGFRGPMLHGKMSRGTTQASCSHHGNRACWLSLCGSEGRFCRKVNFSFK